MPPVTGLNEPQPFFHFWHHPFWPNLASSILNFCRRKTSFQWCPDQGDWPNGARDMHKNAQKVEWKTQSKISCHYTWLLHCKNRLDDAFSENLTASKLRRRSVTAAKRKERNEKEKKKGKKKFNLIKNPKDVGRFLLQKLKNSSQNFDFSTCLSQNVIKRDASGKNGKLSCCKCFVNQIKAHLAEIQPENCQNVQKKRFFAKSPWSQWVKINY